jgi:hypothetical protein
MHGVDGSCCAVMCCWPVLLAAGFSGVGLRRASCKSHNCHGMVEERVMSTLLCCAVLCCSGALVLCCAVLSQVTPTPAMIPGLQGAGLDLDTVVSPSQAQLPGLYKGHDVFLFTSRCAAFGCRGLGGGSFGCRCAHPMDAGSCIQRAPPPPQALCRASEGWKGRGGEDSGQPQTCRAAWTAQGTRRSSVQQVRS